MIELEFQSHLKAPMETVWDNAVSMEGIASEMPPITRMRATSGTNDLRQIDWEPGKVALHCRLVAFDVLPIGTFDLALTEFDEDIAAGSAMFVEQSQMTGMRSWRHQRVVEGDAEQCTVTDTLAFEPMLLEGTTRALIGWFFRQRHKRLRKMYGSVS